MNTLIPMSMVSATVKLDEGFALISWPNIGCHLVYIEDDFCLVLAKPDAHYAEVGLPWAFFDWSFCKVRPAIESAAVIQQVGNLPTRAESLTDWCGPRVLNSDLQTHKLLCLRHYTSVRSPFTFGKMPSDAQWKDCLAYQSLV